ncbi:MAG: hypothetical protein Ct9H90mP30_3070 [Actinomycetota bacterium]|nr:MAG: hypothetical protein Ct9H90mP30_3070 [Actinomycetota bacterium]
MLPFAKLWQVEYLGKPQIVVDFDQLAGYTLEIFHSPIGLRIVLNLVWLDFQGLLDWNQPVGVLSLIQLF